jgi:hypothetical protein
MMTTSVRLRARGRSTARVTDHRRSVELPRRLGRQDRRRRRRERPLEVARPLARSLGRPHQRGRLELARPVGRPDEQQQDQHQHQLDRLVDRVGDELLAVRKEGPKRPLLPPRNGDRGMVRGFDAVLDGPRPHLVLEHLEGPRLSRVIRKQGPWNRSSCCRSGCSSPRRCTISKRKGSSTSTSSRAMSSSAPRPG